MFDWVVLKRGVQESVWFCIGDLPISVRDRSEKSESINRNS